MDSVTNTVKSTYEIEIDFESMFRERPNWWKNYITSIRPHLKPSEDENLIIQVNSFLTLENAWLGSMNKLFFVTEEDFVVFKLKWS